MKAERFKKLANLVIVVSLAASAFALVQMINIERRANQTNKDVLTEAKAQNSIMAEMLPQFKPTEEALEKNRAMTAQLEDLNATMVEINDLMTRTNLLARDSVRLLVMDNVAMERINRTVADSVGPLAWVNDLTALSVALANRSAALLAEMSGDMDVQNAHSASIADKMEGHY
ncbi:MAG: hypothetical protein ACYC55_06545 [Candidatus Geothermincolia bacterium]